MEKTKTSLFRLKTVGADFMQTQLKRCLNTADLTLLGIGHMIGAGVYVLTGTVTKTIAGPGIVLSFMLAGFASLLSALCYAEFGARVPKAGSAYTYSYVTVGEFWAFLIGWNVILEHMLGAAAVARSWSGYLDSLLGHVIRDETKLRFGTISAGTFFGDYPDFIALLAVVGVSLFMGLGAKFSTSVNTIFTFVNLTVIAFIVVVGGTLADFSRWTPFNTPGEGFLPFGFKGVIAGAASCFFAYIGFDGLSTAAEEAKNPARSVPVATFLSMLVVTSCYIVMAATLTLMVDYTAVHSTAAFSDAFEQNGLTWAKYVVAAGALSGMTTSLCGSLFALPRCVYAMANDGLIFEMLAQVHPVTQVPINAVIIFGAFTSLLALLFNIETLVEFLSIGTLMAYTIVSASVIILRYRPVKALPLCTPAAEQPGSDPEPQTIDDQAMLIDEELIGQPKPILLNIAPLRPFISRFEAGECVTWSVAVMCAAVLCFGLATLVHPIIGTFFTVCICVLSMTVAILCLLLILGHHQNDQPLSFKVPLVPFLPAGSVFVNVMLMMYLNPVTWIRLVLWLALGLSIYFLYGIKHSKENKNRATAGTYDSLGTPPAVSASPGQPQITPTVDPLVSVQRQQPIE